jgi:NADH-quinone oxidoreductase subunit A
MAHAPIWQLGFYAALVVATLGGVLILSWLAGERHHERATNEPYESGMLPTGSTQLRLTPQYYLIALLFVIFDLETAYLAIWAVGVREAGWAGFAEASVFVGILAVAVLWLWRVGALDWGPSRPPGGI